MNPIIIYLTLFNLLILAFAFITKKGLYSVTPEEEWADNLNTFNKNVKAIDVICDSPNHKLNHGHLYNND